MSSPKQLGLLLIAAFGSHAVLHDALAAEGLEASAMDVAAQQVSTPDEARIASDLKGQYQFAGVSALGTAPGATDTLYSTAIRSSIRKGDVLEFRVTSVYRALRNDGPQHEVDSTVSYLKDGDGWALQGVQTQDTREIAAGSGVNAADC